MTAEVGILAKGLALSPVDNRRLPIDLEQAYKNLRRQFRDVLGKSNTLYSSYSTGDEFYNITIHRQPLIPRVPFTRRWGNIIVEARGSIGRNNQVMTLGQDLALSYDLIDGTERKLKGPLSPEGVVFLRKLGEKLQIRKS